MEIEFPVNADQSAKIVGVSKPAFWKAVAEGRLPAPVYPAPRAPRWYPSELRAATEATRSLPRDQKDARRLAKAKRQAAA